MEREIAWDREILKHLRSFRLEERERGSVEDIHRWDYGFVDRGKRGGGGNAKWIQRSIHIKFPFSVGEKCIPKDIKRSKTLTARKLHSRRGSKKVLKEYHDFPLITSSKNLDFFLAVLLPTCWIEIYNYWELYNWEWSFLGKLNHVFENVSACYFWSKLK